MESSDETNNVGRYRRVVDKITPELRAQIQSMSSAGVTAKRIAAETNLSYWTVRRRLTQWGYSTTQLRRAEKDERVKELYEAGLSDIQIGKELGIWPSSIALSRKRLGLRRKLPGIKLTDSEVQELESMFQRDVLVPEIAAYFGLHPASVYWRRRRWQKHRSHPLSTKTPKETPCQSSTPTPSL